jgi:hypothetical protein
MYVCMYVLCMTQGEAGYVGKDEEMIPGPEVRHTRALMTEEMEHLDVREQQRCIQNLLDKTHQFYRQNSYHTQY